MNQVESTFGQDHVSDLSKILKKKLKLLTIYIFFLVMLGSKIF